MLAGRLKPGLSADAAASRLETLSRQLERAYPADNRNQLLTVHPLSRMFVSTSPLLAGVGLYGLKSYLVSQRTREIGIRVALARVLYDVKPLDPIVFVTAPVVLGVAAMIATWLPARRATRVTPVTART